MRILVVDDDALAGAMTGAVLEELGHEVELSEDALDAAARVEAGSGIGLIVSDLNMPLVSGLELLRELRGKGCDLPFILFSGDEPGAALAREPGLDACLLKDHRLEETLPSAIQAAMAHRVHA